MNVRKAYAAKILDMNPDNPHPRLPSQWSFGGAISVPQEAERPDELDDRRSRGTSTAAEFDGSTMPVAVDLIVIDDVTGRNQRGLVDRHLDDGTA